MFDWGRAAPNNRFGGQLAAEWTDDGLPKTSTKASESAKVNCIYHTQRSTSEFIVIHRIHIPPSSSWTAAWELQDPKETKTCRRRVVHFRVARRVRRLGRRWIGRPFLVALLSDAQHWPVRKCEQKPCAFSALGALGNKS